MISAGSLSRQITIKAPPGLKDAAGQPSTTWTNLATVWADIRHLKGLESIQSDAETSIVKSSIRIRFRTDVKAGMRAYYGSAVYLIRAVLPDLQNKEYVDLVCEIVNGG